MKLKRLSFITSLGLLSTIVNGETHTHRWILEERKMAPDNYEMKGIIINGNQGDGFGGPTIRATEGDRLDITVINKLQEGTSIHFHGIRQTGTPRMDGVPYITQKPILPGGKFTYTINLTGHAGTYFYHAHSGLQSEHIYGALIIQERPKELERMKKLNPIYDYEMDESIIISELWHKNLFKMEKDLIGSPTKFTGEPDSLLLNSQNFIDWKGKKDNRTSNYNYGYMNMLVQEGKRFRLRIIGAMGRNQVRFKVSKHKLIIIEADGIYTEPKQVDYIDLSGGQRYSVIIEANQPDKDRFDYIISAQVLGTKGTKPNDKLPTKAGVGMFQYDGGFSNSDDHHRPLTQPKSTPVMDRWIDPVLSTSNLYFSKFKSSKIPKLPKKVDRVIVLNNTKIYEDGKFHYLINNNKLLDRDTVLIDDLSTNSKLKDSHVFDIDLGQTVQVVFQVFNPNPKNSRAPQECDSHPWHLHGHSFYVVGSGDGIYHPKLDRIDLDSNLKHLKTLPILRDTVIQYGPTTPSHPNYPFRYPKSSHISPTDRPNYYSCGWLAIRFTADNPGPWLIHCHNTAHMINGMQAVINVKPSSTKSQRRGRD